MLRGIQELRSVYEALEVALDNGRPFSYENGVFNNTLAQHGNIIVKSVRPVRTSNIALMCEVYDRMNKRSTKRTFTPKRGHILGENKKVVDK